VENVRVAKVGGWLISSVIVLTDMHGGSVSVVLAALIEVYVDLFGNRADRVTPVSILLFRETFSCKSLNLYEGDVVEHSGKEVITRVLTYNLY
jgi:mannose/fructose-specific phosphotransferase system component IIA